MESCLISDVLLTPLKRINHPKGDIYHAVKMDDQGFSDFGEAYFSTINQGDIKGWKKHQKMVLNLVVPVGAIRFVIHDDRDTSPSKGKIMAVTLSPQNYCRLTVAPGLWMAFEGCGDGLNMLLNIASIKHDPEEAINKELDSIRFNWN